MPALAHEGRVLAILGRRRPDVLPELLAADHERGWMLQADAGTRLRELIDGDPVRFEELLPLYAQLQLDVAADAPELLAAGSPDRRLAALPAQVDNLLAAGEWLQPPVRDALTDDEVAALRRLAPELLAAGDELAALGLPETIQHDDLHDGNVFVREGRYVFLD